MREKCLSIIVPIYGVEDYILEFLESIVPQLLDSTELILINDGTKDKSMQICHNFLGGNYDNIVILEQSNQGQSVARNYGIQQAKGEYIGFLDPDDYVRCDYISKITECIQNNRDIDIIDFNAVTFIHENKKIINVVNDNLQEGIHDNDEEFLAAVFNNCSWQSWLRIVKYSFFKDVKFPEGLLLQDIHVFPSIYIKSYKVYHISEALIYYRVRRGSAVTKVNDKLIFSYREAIKYLECQGSKEIIQLSLNRLYVDYLVHTFTFYGLKSFIREFAAFKENRNIKVIFPVFYTIFKHLLKSIKR